MDLARFRSATQHRPVRRLLRAGRTPIDAAANPEATADSAVLRTWMSSCIDAHAVHAPVMRIIQAQAVREHAFGDVHAATANPAEGTTTRPKCGVVRRPHEVGCNPLVRFCDPWPMELDRGPQWDQARKAFQQLTGDLKIPPTAAPDHGHPSGNP